MTLQSVTRLLSEIPDSDTFRYDPPRLFSNYAKRLKLITTHLSNSNSNILSSPAFITAIRGISTDLQNTLPILTNYGSKSQIYVLINCKPLCGALSQRAVSIGSWLALLDTSLESVPDLRERVADLALEMQNSDFKVTENEERVYCTLQKEAEVRQNTKAVQSAIIMDLARALGMDSSDHVKLAELIKLLRSDLVISSTVAERRILMSLEKIFDSWSMESGVVVRSSVADFEEDAHIPPYKNFLCPLTKEVMKDPVVLESSQTYERTAIKYWFDRCVEDGRDPTCPVTGQVLGVLDLRPDIGLKGAIDEWVNRNIEVQIKLALECLGEGELTEAESVAKVLDSVYWISEEHPESRYKVRNAGIVGIVVKMLKDQSKKMGSQMRTKALMAMHSMAKDEESKLIMLEKGMTRSAIRSLTANVEKEREYALRLLFEFSSEEDYCGKIALEKGALVLLSSMAGNVEYPTLSNLAEEILKKMEKMEENIKYLALAGRYQPLVTRLCEGTEDVKKEIATLVGNMTLTSNGKDYIARKGGRVLVHMLSSELEGKEASLQALYNLSTLDDNATILVDLGVLQALTDILFATQQDGLSNLRDLAASTIANIVSNSGHWELSSADNEGNPMQSEFIIHRLLELLSQSTSKCQAAILHILCGIASSPQASDLASTHIRTGNGIVAIVPYLDHPEPSPRIHALKLTNILAGKLGHVLAEVFRTTNRLPLLKERLLDADCPFGEKSEIVHILAKFPTSDAEVKTILGPELLKWAISNLKELQSSSGGKNSKNVRSMVEGLLGILLHYARNPNQEILALVQENHFMTIFREQLSTRSHDRAKQLAALGLKYLSDAAKFVLAARETEPPLPRGFCVPLVVLCGKAPMAPVSCPLHCVSCDVDSSFCLLRGNAIKPLVDLMNEESTQVKIAAVEALSTIVIDAQTLKNAADELEQLGLFDAAICLFKEARPGDLQERTMLMVARLLRVESIVQLYGTDQDLVRALVEALKHGNGNTKRYAQDALTNLRQISGVGGKNSSNSRGRRVNR